MIEPAAGTEEGSEIGGEDGGEAHNEAAELYAQARLNRAECWLATGKREEARAEIEQVLSTDPEHPYAAMLLARC